MSTENLNVTFARNWAFGGAIALDSVKDASRKQILASADKDGDGLVTMREARDRLIVGGKGLTDAASLSFKAELEAFMLNKTGLRVDTFVARSRELSHIAYVQVNNAANVTLVEEGDLRGIAAKDPDKPALDKMNLTAEFNTDGNQAVATAAFKRAMLAYFDDLIAKGERLSGFVISGHSNGSAMLQETEHHMYFANMYPRDVLLQIRNSDPKYAKLFDGCEKVAALACFHGGALNEWAEIFPNASIAGAREFAPLSSSHASAALFDQAFTAHQVIEDGKTDVNVATAAALQVPYAGALKSSDPALLVPVDPAALLAKAKQQATIAKAAYDRVATQIADVRRNGRGNVAQATLDQYYAIANNYYLALNDAWIAGGRPGGEQGQEAKAIAAAEFERRDLFAIRKNLTRPGA